MINFEVNNKTFTNFVDASITISLDAMSNYFTFTASANKGFPPFKDGDRIQCFVDTEQVIDGYIDMLSGSERDGEHFVTYSGRDLTQDFIDSDINADQDLIKEIQGSITLQALIQLILKHLDIVDVLVIDELKPEPFNVAEDKIKPKAGQNAFEFVKFWAMKRQALLSSDLNGNILITQSSPVETEQVLRSLPDDEWNDIVSQRWDITGREVFNIYVNRSQQDPNAMNSTAGKNIDAIQDQSGTATDDTARTGRQRVVIERDSYSNEQLQNRAKWSKQMAKARAVNFSCVVHGHSKDFDEGIWRVNELVSIASEAADISRFMLVNAITFTEADRVASTTHLEFVERDVYTINEKIQAQKPIGKLNDAFKSG